MLTSIVNLKGFHSHISGSAGTTSRWLPINDTVPLVSGGVYPIIRLPLPSTYTTWSRVSGPPFSVEYGLNTSRRCLIALCD